jgi:hypothetical protein
MAFFRGPNVVTDGLVLALDAANPRSYVSGSSTWNDLSENNNSGSLINGPTFSSANGGSLVFNGSNYITSSNNTNISGSQPRTLTAWCNFNNIASSVVCSIGGGSNNQLFEIQAFQSRLIGHWYGNYINGTTTLVTGIWYYTTFTYDGTTAFLYLNGTSQGSFTVTLSTTNTVFKVGLQTTNVNMNGYISSAQVYNRALSSKEVLQNYNALKSRFNLN